MSSNSSGNLFAPNERGAALFSACLSAFAIVASWWSDANLTPHLVLTGRVGQLVRSRGRLIGRQPRLLDCQPPRPSIMGGLLFVCIRRMCEARFTWQRARGTPLRLSFRKSSTTPESSLTARPVRWHTLDSRVRMRWRRGQTKELQPMLPAPGLSPPTGISSHCGKTLIPTSPS